MASLAFLPPTSTPPPELTLSWQSWYPCLVRPPSLASEPVSDSAAPSCSLPPFSPPLSSCFALFPHPAATAAASVSAPITAIGRRRSSLTPASPRLSLGSVPERG